MATLLGILGTTISPYLFFWQVSQEVEEQRSEGRSAGQRMPLQRPVPGPDRSRRSLPTPRRFYGVLAAAMAGGLAIDYVGIDAVKMLFWSAVLNGALAPPLILLVILLTNDRKVMGDRVNSPALSIIGWITLALMSAATVGMLVS